MTAAEATVDAMLAHGIDTIYALPGVQNDHLFDGAVQGVATGCGRSTPGTNRARPIWRSARRWRPASRRPTPWCRGRACSIPSAALLTAYSMNAPVLALIGEIPDADIGRHLGHLHEIRDQAGIIKRLVDYSRADPQARAGAAPGRRGDARRWRPAGPGPASLQCAIDVWGKSGAVTPQAPLPVRAAASSTRPRSARPRSSWARRKIR